MAEPGLKKFLKDQEEAVQLARDTAEGADQFRVEAVNIALSLAHVNALACDQTQNMKALLADADVAEKWLKGQQNA